MKNVVDTAKEEGREEGREEGSRNAKYEIAKQLKENKMTLEEIAKITGIDKEEIENL